MGLGVFAWFFLGILYALYFAVIDFPDSVLNFVGFCILWTICWFMGVIFYNHYPTFWLTEEGIYVTFGIGRKLIPWEDVKAVKSGLVRQYGTLVLVKHLTRYHYLYGSLYFSPGFLIDPTIKEYREVIATIQEQIKLRDRQRATGNNP